MWGGTCVKLSFLIYQLLGATYTTVTARNVASEGCKYKTL